MDRITGSRALGNFAIASQSHHQPDELQKAKLEKNSSTLFTTGTRSTRRCTENLLNRRFRISDCGLS